MNLFSLAHAATSTCTVNGDPVDCAQLGNAVKGFAAFAFIIPAIFGIVGLALFVFWIMMLVHVAKHPIKDKALWVIVLLVGNGVGAIVYYFAVKRHYDAMQVAPGNVPPTAPIPPSAPPAI